ncbi:helicase with zinc finger domain 2 isoform X1 [Molossus molossus]|nr:helicase with zinc finger domain 2 isoform X1 [Molossus molossus]XP_036099977.1 helicase with zinc finger domain 2 isoform X1 [Molossus molossus]XP_036099978.1 helicase with zinc finger domain 2 isoform X1 [Molossus molossus]XP_036099980.1 helicase with zinc finger domain 2 isoform X1 [Molossus molossus]
MSPRRARPALEMVSPGSGPLPAGPAAPKEPALARLCAQVDLCLGCSRCAQRLNESTYLLHPVEHSCPREILLARFKHATQSSIWRKVNQRPSFPRPARYEVCRYYSPGQGCRRHRNQCTFARSPEEALVWTFEREHSVHRLWLKAAVEGGGAQGKLRNLADTIREDFGGHFQLLCSRCFRLCPPRLSRLGPQRRCHTHGAGPSILAHVSSEGRHQKQVVEVRPQPQYRRPLTYCMFVERGRPCRHGAARCQYAHSAVEMAVWKAEQQGGLQRADLLTCPAPRGSRQLAADSQPPAPQLYCHACLVTCGSQEAFENHCSSPEHVQMVAQGQAVAWVHRSPPTGLSAFELCPRPALCEYGNSCTKAHSEQELQEWTQRVQTAQLREQAAWQEGLVPYRERLLAEYQRSSSEVLVLAETIDGVSVACDQPLVHRAQEKKIQHSWTFVVHSEEPLQHVALLKQEPGADFSLVAARLPLDQVYAQGERFRTPDCPSEFQVGVRVQSASFGTFEQWVVFDFGRRPALLQRLVLQLGQEHRPGGLLAPGHPEELERWNTGNRHVVPGVERTAEQAALMAKYKVPALALEFSRGSPAPGPLSCTNYRQRMHQFLYEEEAAQQQLVAKLNLRAPVSLKTSLQTPALGMLFPPPGALYAEVPIPSSLAPDTDQGFLLSRAVSTALLAPVPAPDRRVFEVRLETRASSEQARWLLLPAHCCEALGLQPETSPLLEVQFQVDLLTFRLWHEAVDALPEERLVVPDLQACALPCRRPSPPALHGNRKQKLAVELIVSGGPGGQPVAPLLIYGPFGTGKTYTLALASLEVIRQPHTKVLICTHTNSAADIYIQEHFHGHVTSGHPEATPLRVMYTDRPPSQTDAATLQYCCLTKDRRAFRPPTRAELEQHRIVVATTSQARELQVPAGFFSHILIDEAAQMLECEALTPLRYALPSTRVVLAGDHMQVTPRLFSVDRAQAAGHTLLHRLFRLYQQQTHEEAQHSRLIFHENYRSTEAIIDFVSRHFYVAKGNPIVARGKVPRHPRRYPLMFCHVAGNPERDLSLMSWLNTAEVVQVVEQVQELCDTWPQCWGSCEQRHICVVSHGAQVSVLRQELRRRDLGQVSVGSFEILPGREFRVVVLSTIHNHQSLQSPGAPPLEFFTDARVLNTIMTRAQSQVVAVGDAVALCSFGACSKLWKSFIRQCVEHRSVCPEGLSLEHIEQAVVQRQRWARYQQPTAPPAERSVAAVAGGTVPEEGAAGAPAPGHAALAEAEEGTFPARTFVVGDTASGGCPAGGDSASAGNPAHVVARPAATDREDAEDDAEDAEDSESDFWSSDGELNADDAILQELLDESRNVSVTVREDGLLDTVARPASPQRSRQYVNLPRDVLRQLLRQEPELHHRCTFVPETFERATAMPLEDTGPGPIQLRGRLHCGMAFSGDEVLVKVLGRERGPAGRPQGRVLGVLKRRRHELTFVCRMDEWDPRIMTPIDGSVTKIFVADLKDPLQVPVHRLLQGRVQRVGFEPLTAQARRHRLFWVRIVAWRERFYYPLGIVLEVLPEATTWEQGLSILDLEYGLKEPSPDPAVVSKALQRYSAELARAPGSREDCRSFLTFTVDPQGACNLDDALSVQDLGSRYEVAVHITDVASFVPRDTPLDVEARRQGIAFYAPNRVPTPMLPADLCQDMLSLLPGQDRFAISLFLTFEKGSDQLKSLRFAPSVICSDRQLSYEEAEQVLRAQQGAGRELPARLDSVEACVLVACHFSRALRQRRLEASCHYEQLDEDSTLGFRTAHTMVKEYMIQFNSRVAEFLVGCEHTRTVTPLRCQPTPSGPQLEAVSEKHGEVVPLSLHLRHHLRGHSTPGAQLHLLAALWRHVLLAAHTQDVDLLVDLITTDDMHPSLAAAGLDFRKALGRSAFGRSSQGEQNPTGHYSLQVEWYTWATSPIRRYLDVVLQRQILLALGQGGSTYSARDINRLCQDFSRQHARAQSYQRRAYSLHLATRLKAQPCQKLGFVLEVEPGARCFRLLFPVNRETLPDPCPVYYRALQLAEHPSNLESRPGLRLKWRRRVYSVRDRPCAPLPGALLDPHTWPVDSALWQQLLELVEEQRWPEAAALVRQQDTEKLPQRALGQVAHSRCGHFVEAARELSSGDTLQVQLSATLQRGVLAPFLQLWVVAPGLSLCLEHVERPGDCFSGHVPRAGRDQCRSLEDYCRVWEPFCSLESATSAVAESDAVTLQQVHVAWDAERPEQGPLQGRFCLDAAFLREHSIDIGFGQCYLCIRLEGLRAAPPAVPLHEPGSLVPALSIDPDTYTWVAHGLTEDPNADGQADQQEATRQVRFFVHHMAMEKVPEEVLRPGTLFTVEVLPKQLPDLRKEEAVRRLKDASQLVISIALGHPIPLPRPPPHHLPGRHPPHHLPGRHPPHHLPGRQPLRRGTPSRFLGQQTFDIPRGRHQLNPSQNGAVREALQKPFTVIQGPPGTGKTVVGFHIVFWFHKSNQELAPACGTPAGKEQLGGPCILYCGPSNKSVDVLAGMLLSWKAELKPLRVYGEQAEATEFPMPGVSSRGPSRRSSREGRPNQTLRAITLHHRIRQPSNPFAPSIKAFDARLQKGEIFSEEDLAKYRKVLGKARKFELDRHRVILCTCSCAASASLKSLDVRQILVDEAGMATEPETLIPLVNFCRAEKVVLLGDHKQLRPVVKNEQLQNLGLDRSLFERYRRDAHMLDTQYRMHEGICSFPSMEFYQERLKTWQGLRRPPSVLGHAGRESCPVIFGHVQGHEQSLLVSTDEGNENSKANLEEVKHVVRIAKQLTLDRTVDPKDIAILTPYNAQAAEISKGLAQRGVTGVTVCSITKSQGSEWRYVLVSTVRSCPESDLDQRPTKSWLKRFLGFVVDPNQVNVALTRAQEGLCLVGDHHLLRCCPLWCRLLDFCEAQRSLVPAEQVQVQRRPAVFP